MWRGNTAGSFYCTFFGSNSCRSILISCVLLGMAAEGRAQAPSLSIGRVGEKIELQWPSADPDFSLERSMSLSAPLVWGPVFEIPAAQNGQFRVQISPGETSQFFRLRKELVAPFATILASSPLDEESGVAVTRETVLEFSQPLAADVTLGAERLNAEFGGRRILSRNQISGDRKTVTLFYLENLPASARVKVSLDTTGLKDAKGKDFDGDGNGLAGGVYTMHFGTVGNTALASTAVIGKVFASERNTDGSNRPLQGVTVTVDGAEETLRTVTDATGAFKLQPAPAGRFFVHVDGRTAIGSDWPNGAYYPFVGKAWEAVAGKVDNLAGGTGEIFLPLVAGDALKAVSATSDTTVTMPASLLAENPEFAGVSITVPANALFNADGQRGGKVGLAPVPADRLPEPLPPGLNFPIVITIQTDGPQNFDQPVPVRFPNLPDPVTGLKLPAGAKTVLWSFNHDTGRWEAQGTATITADGNFAETDPGVGVRQPGWHGVAPGTSGAGPRNECYGPDCECVQEITCTIPKEGSNYLTCALRCLGNATKKGDAKSTPLEAGLRCIGGPDKCPPNIEDTLSSDRRDCVERCRFPKPDKKTYLMPCEGYSDPCPSPFGAERQTAGQLLEDRFEEQLKFWEVEGEFLATLMGTTKILNSSSAEIPRLVALLGAFGERSQEGTPAGIHLSAEERAELIAMPKLSQFTDVEWAALIDRFDSLQGVPKPADVVEAEQKLDALIAELKQRGWKYRLDGMLQGHMNMSWFRAPALGTEQFPARAHFYRLYNHDTGLDRRGRLSSAGLFEGLILAPEEYYTVEYFDPVTGNAGGAFFQANRVGQTTVIPTALMEPLTLEADSDADGLQDIAEEIVGTNPANADTDNDGIKDGAEVAQGLNPLDGFAMQQGIIASVKTIGSAIDIAAFNNLVVIAEGAAGVSIFDVQNIFNPIRVAQVDTAGEAGAVALDGIWALAADGNKGLAVIDISTPGASVLVHQVALPGTAVSVTAAGGLAYIGLSNGSLSVVEIASGRLLETLAVGSAAITDLTIVGNYLYALLPPKLATLVIEESSLSVAKVTDSPGIVGFNARRLRLTGGNGFLYAVSNDGFNVFSLANPLDPALAAREITAQRGWKQIVPNGSGLGVAAVGSASNFDPPHDVYLYDLRPPGSKGSFLTTLVTPGLAGAISLYNGLAYVADGDAGLQVLNYTAADTQGVAPTITLGASFQLSPVAQAESRVAARLVATVNDDVQVRNVEFYADGTLLGVDGNFPFELSFITPQMSPEKTSFTIRAKATDTGGNFTWTPEMTVALVPDATAPKVRRVTPIGGGKVIDRATVFFSELVDPAKINATTFHVLSAGADGMIGTEDDSNVNATYSVDQAAMSATALFSGPLAPGLYMVTLSTGITDLNNNALATGLIWQFRVGDGVFWIGQASGGWNLPGNWSTGVVPGPDDIAVIDLPFGEQKFTINAGAIVLKGLMTFEEIEITGGSISAAEWLAARNVTLNGGAIGKSTITVNHGFAIKPVRNFNNMIENLTVNGDIVMEDGTALNVRSGLALNGKLILKTEAFLRFLNTQSLASGTIEFAGNSATIDVQNGAVVTLAAGTVLRGKSGSIGGGGTLLNLGKIQADVSGGHMQVQPASFTHNGVAEVINVAQLSFGGSWGGAGTIAVTEGTFNLAGLFGPVNTPITKTSAGVVRIRGTGNLQGSTLTLNAATGSWLLSGGSLANGTLTQIEGSGLLPVRDFNNVLENLTVNGDIVMEPSTALNLRNGMSLNGKLVLKDEAFLRFLNNQTFAGGTIEFAGNSASIDIQTGATVTFAAGTLLRGKSGSIGGGGALVNAGGISADVTGGHLQVQPASFTHNGTAQVLNGAQLTFAGNWGGTGTIAALNGTFNLGGQFGPLTTAITKGANGQVRIRGTGNLQGSTITLTAETGSWLLSGGTLANGTLVLQGADLRPIRDFNNVLQAMTVNGDILMEASTALNLRGGLTLNGRLIMKNEAFLRFLDTQTVGAGEIVFESDSASIDVQSGASVTLAAGTVLHGKSGSVGGGGTLINQGRISADVAGGHLQIQPATFTHNGAADVINGAQLSFGGTWGGTGTIAAVNGTFNLGGQFGPVTTAITKAAEGQVRVRGTGNLQGSILTLNAATGSWLLSGGTLRNGTLSMLEGAGLLPLRDFNNVLESLTVNGDIVMEDNTALNVRGGLTLNGKLILKNDSFLRFLNTQTIAAGTIEFAGTSATIDLQSGAVVTLAAPVVLRGGGGSIGGGGTLINQGTILADVAARHLQLQSAILTHNGTAEVRNGAQLTFAGTWGGTGAIAVGDGTFNLGGQFGPVTTSITKEGAGEVRIRGNGNLQGSTLTLNAETGSWMLHGGTLANGTLALTEGAELKPVRDFNNVLQALTINGNLVMEASTALNVRGGLALTGTLSMNNDAFLRFLDTQTFAAGTIEFVGTSSTIDLQSGATLTLAAGTLLHGRTGTVGGGGTLVNQGKISADVAGGTIRIQPASFVNQGQIEEINGGNLIAPGFP